MDVLRPEPPEINVPPSTTETQTQQQSSFNVSTFPPGKSMKVTEPGRFQCPEQQISCSFPSNPKIPTLQLSFVGITLTWARFPFPALLSSLAPINCSPQNHLPWHPHALGSSQSPGPCWDAGACPVAAVGTSLSTLGCRGHWEGFKGSRWFVVRQKGTPQGELMLPQQNHSAWRS